MESRPLDYLYDPTNVVGCRTDHIKSVMKAQTYTVGIEPVFPNMFSKLPHYPSVELRYRPANAVNLNYIQQNPAQRESGMNKGNSVVSVQGSNRFKYHRRPLVPYIGGLNSQVYYDTARQISARLAVHRSTVHEPATKTIAIQTMFRESGAQTDPYTPDYVLPPPTPGGTQYYPEVLTLASLSYGNGLPVSVEEIERIERAREKRKWKEALPTGTDQESFEKRLKMMEKMELQEWNDRENEISKVQKTRLDILIKLIEKRRQENDAINKERLEKAWTMKLQEKDEVLMKLEKKKERDLRRLDIKRRNVENRPKKKDPIEKYSENAVLKKATLLKKQNISAQIPVYKQVDALTEIENAYKEEIEKVDVQLNLGENLWKEPKIRQEMQYQKNLDYIWNHVINKGTQKKELTPLRFKSKIEKDIVRATTPRLTVMGTPQQIYQNKVALYIQKLLRGKSVEIEMKQGLRRNQDLVDELRARHRHELLRPQSVPKSNQFKVVIEPEDELERDIETSITAAYLGKMFDYYTKELVRLREERRLAAMVLLAERTRRMRESEELARRKEELSIRTFEEKAYIEAMSIHNMTVDSYLEGIIADSIETTGDIIAREAVEKYQEDLKQYEQTQDQSKIVNDLVLSFLIPEVWRQGAMEDFNREQSKYLKAARDCLESTDLYIPEEQSQPEPAEHQEEEEQVESDLTDALADLSLREVNASRQNLDLNGVATLSKSKSSLAASREFEAAQQ